MVFSPFHSLCFFSLLDLAFLAQQQLFSVSPGVQYSDCEGRERQEGLEADGPLGPRGLAEATEMCTQECLVLGHSDNCWMPPGLGPYQHPKSPLSTFAPQKEWVKKDKLVNGHTLTRAWKEDTNRNQFNDRKQYGSNEGHFNNGSHMADIPLANLKSYKQAGGTIESPKEHQL
ncbi:hypothetical protein ACRRTK_019341 [Alexandromys fortis]